MFRAYQIYLVLIKVDFFFFVGFSIQFIYLTLTKRAEDPEYWLTIIVLPLTIVILYIAVYAVRHESRKWMSVFLVAMLCGVVYFIFKVIRMFVNRKVSYEGVYKFLTLFGKETLSVHIHFMNGVQI
jgi:4-hydroxybenzoate polyprenyltransferase